MGRNWQLGNVPPGDVGGHGSAQGAEGSWMGSELGKTDYDSVWGKNIRELLGHKVDLGFVESNAAVRLDKV